MGMYIDKIAPVGRMLLRAKKTLEQQANLEDGWEQTCVAASRRGYVTADWVWRGPGGKHIAFHWVEGYPLTMRCGYFPVPPVPENTRRWLRREGRHWARAALDQQAMVAALVTFLAYYNATWTKMQASR